LATVADPDGAPLDLFHAVVGTVPAYRQFLAEHGVDASAIRTSADFRRLPVMTKQNYVTRYPLPDRCRDGRLDSCDMIAVSSGSSGAPTIWPRSAADEIAITSRFEQVFVDAFAATERRTLAVVCFPLGTWVGGLFTLACVRHLAARGLPITAVAPGNNVTEILRVVPELGRFVDQVVLLGYPPFLKQVIDAGTGAGLDWSRYAIKLVLAGEVFSEQWRDLVSQRAGIEDIECGSAALYGTADAGVLGNETRLSVRIRRFLAQHPDAGGELFGEARLPTLVQYDPSLRYFETADDGTLMFSGDSGVPLVRYGIGDTGGTVSFVDMIARCRRYGFDPLDAAGPAPDLPFVYVYGRALFTVSYYGANVYVENIAGGLERPDVSDWVTGRFVLEVRDDADRDRELWVTVELAAGEPATPDRAQTAAESIRAELRRRNSEFANYVPEVRQLPQIELRPANDPKYFPTGVKHRYTR
jgi:phenylacetate-CoA ligase